MNRALVALAIVLVAGVAIPVGTPFALVALVPLFYATRAGSWRTAAGGTAAVVAAVASQSLIWGDDQPAAAYIATAALALAAAMLGLYSGGAPRRTRSASASCWPTAAAAEERLRIARELHDAVGHDVSLMVVQAQALGASDERVREATDAIADLGRRTMAELHRTAAGCSAVIAEGARTPSDLRPGVLAVSRTWTSCVDRARAAGVPLSVTVDGAPRAAARPPSTSRRTGSSRRR